MKEMECDALGIDCQGNQMYYAVDVAFHTNGLGYKNNENKVTEKCLRIALCIAEYIGKVDAAIIFATPKISKTTLSNIQNKLKCLETITNNLGYNYKFKIFANDEFCTRILMPVISLRGKVNDMSEVFMRSVQLLDTCSKKLFTSDCNIKSSYEEMKVGQIANIHLRAALESGHFANFGQLVKMSGKI